MSLSVLFIGGRASSARPASSAPSRSDSKVTVPNRGTTAIRPLPDGVRQVRGDIRDPDSVRAALGDESFDVVVEFAAFTPEHVQQDIDLFAGRTAQYVFISSASAYQTPPTRLPITESTPAAEPLPGVLAGQDRLRGPPGGGVPPERLPDHHRPPSHTNDRTALPVDGGWTIIDLMRRGDEVVVLGDGTSLWTLTHTDDVAVGLVGLFGASAAIGEAFHITGDETPTWIRSTAHSRRRPESRRASCT
ncbi:hypothetical protein Q0F99_18090 [Rathayibacter oskolensis]|uniref:hypothetical protein n=1 Tax=Rathayibacter oskolensis TaxID=1891671 RepID=UPI0026601878|nr:hypothetical protein [Rathayibacter oskolensis]WKK71329.1 hypothetical protein Q0F99_18090 [Rathayibacter oskolensis]